MARSSLNELIGKNVAVVFNLDPYDWPISGYPANTTVKAVALPLIKLNSIWINTNIIKTIKAYD